MVCPPELLTHLKKNNFPNPHQPAYRSGHSTETALLRVVNDLLGFDEDKASILALLDPSAAFDTIDHSILLTRLQHSFGICDLALAWFCSYLTNRKQTVCMNRIYSDPSALMYSVPQGSVLGTILFVLYATPVSDIINYHSLHHERFADDTKLHKSARIAEFNQLISRIQDCITDLKTRMIHKEYSSIMTKQNLCSLHLKGFTTIPLSLLLCSAVKSIFLFLHLFAALVSFSTKHCLSNSMS